MSFERSKLPVISIIIPTRGNGEKLPILDSIVKADYPTEKLEIVIATGQWPSSQRNKAADKTKGEILCFFNRDVSFKSDIFNKIVEIFERYKNIAGVGGPDLIAPESNFLQCLFNYAMGSYFAHWKMSSRYCKVGKERLANEKNLLLSNLAIKKNLYLKAKGFNEHLYPNEENELINKINNLGYEFIYSPEVKVFRERRKTVSEFIEQFYRYGVGRMNQIKIEGLSKNIIFIIPLLFLIYLITLIFCHKELLFFYPLFFYLVLALMDAFRASMVNKQSLMVLPIIYFIMHISYAFGLISGMFKRDRNVSDIMIIKKDILKLT